ncbi:MAG TPA: hypothetical protein VFU29_00915 [Chitinophagaceae bacterium]|nr:hypothetical protein [Chitinophagaceae bacterium]
MKKIILASVFATLLVTACNKQETPAPAPSLIGKWGVVNILDKEVDNGAIVYNDNYTGQSSDYMEFKNDNTLGLFVDGFGLILNYKLLPNNKVEISGDTLTIQSLTANSAILYQKDDNGPNSYEETTYNLKR